MAFVTFDHVTYQYPMTDHPVLRDISFEMAEGEFVALVGPNGAGKSSLCYTLSGFIPHFFKGDLQGSILVDGKNPVDASLHEWVLDVGLVFQNPFNQISGSKFTVFEEIAFGLENTGVPRGEMVDRVEEMMLLTGIAALGDRSPYSLSGGQQQRVALASILVMKPKVLVLDEPTSQLDPIGSREVFQVIKRMSGQGMTVLIVEHKMEWIATFADRVLALHDGAILLDGPPDEVLTSPLLPERGFGLSRYTSVARSAQREGLWQEGKKFPVTLEEAVSSFSRSGHAD